MVHDYVTVRKPRAVRKAKSIPKPNLNTENNLLEISVRTVDFIEDVVFVRINECELERKKKWFTSQEVA